MSAADSGVTHCKPSKNQRRALQDAQRAQKTASRMKQPCEMLLIRHGETDWNKERRIQGQQQPGPGLNQMGWQQAQLVADVLQQRYPQVDAVISSDLQRTTETAEVLSAKYGLQVQQHPGLRERHLGVLQGLTFDEAAAAEPEGWAALRSAGSDVRIPGGGESLDDLQGRMVGAICEIASQHRGKRVIVVSHGGALHSVHRAARGYQSTGKVINCGISVLLVAPTPAPSIATAAAANTMAASLQEQQQQHGQSDQSNEQEELLAAAEEYRRRGQCSQAEAATPCCAAGSEGHSHVTADGDSRNKGSTSTSTVDGYCLSGYRNGRNISCSSSDSCFCRDVAAGRLALVVWNDGHELIRQGLLGAAGISGQFGGSAREG